MCSVGKMSGLVGGLVSAGFFMWSHYAWKDSKILEDVARQIPNRPPVCVLGLAFHAGLQEGKLK